MFEALDIWLRSNPIEVKARFVNGLPGAYPGPQPKTGAIVNLRMVVKIGDTTYYKVKGYSDWFYASRFKEVA